MDLGEHRALFVNSLQHFGCLLPIAVTCNSFPSESQGWRVKEEEKKKKRERERDRERKKGLEN